MLASEIAKFLGKPLIGKDIFIFGICSYRNQKDNCVAFSRNDMMVSTNKETLVIINKAATYCDGTYIKSDNPRLDHTIIADMFFPAKSHCCEVKQGNNCYIKPGAVLGYEGFGFERNRDGVPIRRPHVGGLILGNNVEVGANSVIARGTFDDTVIEDNVKIDDHVFIAHNCHIGKNTMIVAGTVVCGSVTVGSNCWLGANCTIRQGLKIGDNVTIGIGAVVTKNIPDNETWAGNPAKKMEDK